MPRHQQSLAIVAIVVLLAVFAYLAVRHNQAVGRVSTDTGTLPNQQYVNTTYGFSFSYPPQYDLIEYTHQDVSLSDSQTGKALADISVKSTDGSASFKTYDEFAVHQASLLCEEESAAGSARCPRVSRSESFTAKTSAVGTVMYLEYVVVSTDATTTREAGPFFVFNISRDDSGTAFQALLIRPTRFAEESPAYDAGAALAHSVADSLKTTMRAQ